MLPLYEHSTDKQAQGCVRGFPFKLLPSTTEPLICGSLDHRGRRSLLQTSRWGRDAVLREARSIELSIRDSDVRPLARLLARACEAAEAGQLSVYLFGSNVPSTSSNVLADLLAPAQQQGGWSSVKELGLQYLPESSTPVLKLVSTTFPALQSIWLRGISVTRADLGSLSACSQLSSLKLNWCKLQQAGPSSTISPLSALHSLRRLWVAQTEGVTSSFVVGLTQLTGLTFGCDHKQETMAQCLGHILSLTQLQGLELAGPKAKVTAKEVTCILTSLNQLTSLNLHHGVHQPEFDALLTHGTHLTSLTCSELHLDEDRSESPCSWKELVIDREVFNAETLALLPIRGLTRLAFQSGDVFPCSSPLLEFYYMRLSDADDEPEVMHRSLVNLMRCPAWQQCGPKVRISLIKEGYDDIDSPEVLALVRALAPLASKEVSLAISMSEALIGASEVQQLGIALGSSLKQLTLYKCEVEEDFWSAVWAHLPGLQQLKTWEKVSGAIGVDELAAFCSRATRPLQLNLWRELYKEVAAEGKLDQQGRWMGVPQVTVTKAK